MLAAVQEVFDLRDDAVFRAASGLAGGLGLTGAFCGALTGGVMALSQRYGRERHRIADPARIRYKSYDLARKLYERFLQEYGTASCRGIQERIMGRPYDLWDPKEMEAFEAAGGHDRVSPEVVGKAARWVAEMILEEDSK